MNTPCYLIIGNGRMARHMAYYLDHLGLSYHTFSRQTHDHNELPDLLAKTSHVLILIRDDAIEDFIRTHLQDIHHTLVHFSGSLSTPLAYGVHPLVSFSHTLQPLDIYHDIWFIVEENDKTFAELLPGLPNHSAVIPADAKSLYHSLCVLSGNFTCLLWEKFYQSLSAHWHIPKEAADTYLQLIMRNIVANPEKALTGPLVRDDQQTIKRNLNALENDPYHAVYTAFVGAYQKEHKK